MNKKIFTRIISFVLVVCLLLPVIPNLGLDLSGVVADASYDTSANTIYFKSGTKNYIRGNSVASKAYATGSHDVITRDGVVYIPTSTLTTLGITPNATFAGANIDGVSGVDYAKAVNGEVIGSGYKVYITDANLVALSTGTPFTNVTAAEQQTIIDSFAMDHLIAGTGSFASDGNAGRFTYKFTATSSGVIATTDYMAGGSKELNHPYLLANDRQFIFLANAYDKPEGDTDYDPVLQGYLASVLKNAENVYNSYWDATNNTIKLDVGLVEARESDTYNVGDQGKLYNMPYYTNWDSTTINSKSKTEAPMNGYDEGGRQNESANHASRIASLAFAYQILSRSEDSANQALAATYAQLAFEYAACLSNWEHWGAGHFLNAADASYYMALAYDWCYEAWKDLSYQIPSDAKYGGATYNLNSIRNALFIKGVYAGLVTSLSTEEFKISSTTKSSDNFCPWYNNQLGGYGTSFTTADANWNAVCTAGMTMAALALINDSSDYSSLSYKWIKSSGTAQDKSGSLNKIPIYANKNDGLNGTGRYVDIQATSFGDASAFLLNKILYTLEARGLDIYGLYGDYRESLSYWNYGTSSLFAMIAALETTLGDDYGLSAAAGIDKTAYFSYYAQSGDGLPWKYGDDGYSNKAETPMNGLFGAVIGDDNIVSYRKYLISTGAAAPTYYDLFRYDENIGEEDFKEMSLDYYFKGIEGFSSRDSWQPGSMYVAFGGGAQQASHAQLDSGAFVYYNNGVKWFEDLGAENYNVSGGYGYGQAGKESDYQHYRATSEGNNCLVSGALTYGQKYSNVTTTITEVNEGNAYGSFAILDQSAAFNGTAKRGILTTNDRRTVVIQDEVTLSSAETLYWMGHLSKNKTVTLADAGRTAYITDGNSTIRCTIVSGNTSLAFECVDIISNGNYNKVLSGTLQTPADGTNDLTGYQRLQIKAENVTSLNLAVVIEEIMPGYDAPVNYDFVSMTTWGNAIAGDDRSYDKVLLDKNFDVEGIGSFTSQNGNIKLLNTKVNGDNAMGLYANDSLNSASSLILTAAPSRVELANIGKGMLVAEFDVATLDKIPENLKFGIYGADTVHPIVGGYLGDSSFFGDFDRDFTHITIVLDEDNDMFYLFSGNTCVKAEHFTSKSYAGLSVRFTTDSNAMGGQPDGTALIDNVVVRHFTERYEGLDSYIEGASVGSDIGILEWADKTGDGTHSTNVGAVGIIYNIAEKAEEEDKDSPVIDFWGWGAAAASETQTQAAVEATEKEAATFEELEELINSGEYTNVELYRSNTEIINITTNKSLSVDTKGYNFLARATEMVCNVNGDVYEYTVGSLSVTFVVNGTSHSVNVNSSDYAVYEDLDDSVLGGITPKENGDGTVTFYVRDKGAWSLVDGGEVVHGADLIVTSENNKFYLASETVYNGLYIIKDGIVYRAGGNTIQELRNDLASSYTKIILTSDVVITQTGTDPVNFGVGSDKNIKLDLNGFTLTYTGDIGNHLFLTGYRTYLEVNGPGNIVNLSPQNAVLYMGQVDKLENSATVVFNKVNVSTTQNFLQMRSGSMTLNDCTINSLNGQTLFNIGSEGGGHWENETNTDFTVDGGVINFNGSNKYENNVLRLLGNGTATFKGGVVINTSANEAAIAVARGINSAKSGYTVNGYKLRLGEVYFSNPDFFYDGAYQTDDKVVNGYSNDGHCQYISFADLKSEAKLKYIEGAVFTDDEYASENSYVDSGYWAARTGEVGYSWKVVPATDAINVKFYDGSTEIDSQYWALGAIPSIIGEAKDYIDNANKSAPAGTKYTYDMSALAGGGVAGGTSYSFYKTEAPNATLRMSISLYSEFVVNILFQTTGIGGSGTVDYSLIKVDGVAFSPDMFSKGTVNGDEYVYVSVKLKADEASKVIGIYAEGTDNNGNSCKITTATSIVKYASNVINSSATDESKQLMKSIISYIGATAGFVNDRYTEASCNVVLADATISGIKTPDTAIANVAEDVENTKNIANAVSSAQIALGKSPNFVFNFNSGYSGTVTFTYKTNMSDSNVVTAVTVANGNITSVVVGGKALEGVSGTSYQLDMRTFDMAENIAISVDGAASVNYSLDVYYAKAVQDSDALYDLIIALKSYCITAREYRNANAK